MPENAEIPDPIKFLILTKFNSGWIVFSEFTTLDEASAEFKIWRERGWNLKLVQEISGE